MDIVDHTRGQPVVLLELDPARPDRLAALGGFSLPTGLDGSAGTNRAERFCLIQAGNDLQAVEFYLSRFDDQPHTLRAYRGELERFLLWCILVQGKPMSSMLVGECEAYKSFLACPSTTFAGVCAPRFSARWKPFSTTPMVPRSQRQAVVVLRAAFDYLVKVRYLAGNPWVAVRDPRVAGTVYPMQIERALGRPLWATLTAVLGEHAAAGETRWTGRRCRRPADGRLGT